MKKAGLILIFALLFALNSKAQTDFIDSAKNEIGININPFLESFGILSNTDYMTLQFKHHYTNVSLRVGITGLNNSTYSDNEPRNYRFKITDSTRLFDHVYDTKNSIRLNIGLEQQQMLKNKCKFYYGFDILGGYTTEETRTEQSTFQLGFDSTFYHALTKNDSIITSTEHILVGAAFVSGFDYFFSKRISAGIQGYFPISFEFQTGNSRNKSSRLNFDQKFSFLITIHL